MKNVACPICSSDAEILGTTKIIDRFEAIFWMCPLCQYVWIPDPYWLREIDPAPVFSLDKGMVRRNIYCSEVLTAFIEVRGKAAGKMLDFAGGTGLLTQLMRDRGYLYYSFDPSCSATFAQEFASSKLPAERYSLVSASEVIEHLDSPMLRISELLKLSSDVILTTEMLPWPPPALNLWPYFGLNHGQHISFFSELAFAKIAQALGVNYAHAGVFHHFSTAKCGYSLALAQSKLGLLFGKLFRRKQRFASGEKG